MSGVLDAILASKRAEIARLVESPAATPKSRRDGRFFDALVRDRDAPLRLIGEIKRRSPSAGELSSALDVGARALAYARGGVSAISVLCDGPFFGGSFLHLDEARAALDAAALTMPLLAKEFVLDPRQLDEAAAHGADAALLIARILTPKALAGLAAHARGIGLEPLVEVVTEDEVAAAIDADARVIGVNARDLDSLAMDREGAARVLAAIPAGRIKIRLSGLKAASDVGVVARSGVDAALIGEALMRLDDPSPLLVAMGDATRG